MDTRRKVRNCSLPPEANSTRSEKTGPPFWGSRRLWAWLKYRDNLWINQKKVRRLMKENRLMATQKVL